MVEGLRASQKIHIFFKRECGASTHCNPFTDLEHLESDCMAYHKTNKW